MANRVMLGAFALLAVLILVAAFSTAKEEGERSYDDVCATECWIPALADALDKESQRWHELKPCCGAETATEQRDVPSATAHFRELAEASSSVSSGAQSVSSDEEQDAAWRKVEARDAVWRRGDDAGPSEAPFRQ